jgi:carbon-monoxide dehydrogenase large subunit
VDDVVLPGMLYMDIVRSPFAHAKIKKIDTAAALKVPGVLAVITGETLAGFKLHWMPTLMSDTQMVLPVEKVMYQAQEVAAGHRHRPLRGRRRRGRGGGGLRPAAGDRRPLQGPRARARRCCARTSRTRRTTTSSTGRWGTARPRAGLQVAAAVVKQRIYIPRIHVASIETCGCVASFNKTDGKLTVWMTTQAPHAIRTVFALVAGHVGLSEEKIRIISPDIGGGFGGKVPSIPAT